MVQKALPVKTVVFVMLNVFSKKDCFRIHQLRYQKSYIHRKIRAERFKKHTNERGL